MSRLYITPADVGRKVRLRNQDIVKIDKFEPYRDYPVTADKRTYALSGRHWSVGYGSPYDIIAWADEQPEPDQTANAHLIASAPELLDALENLLAVMNGEGGTKPFAQEIARKAIAKAKGEQP